MEIKQRKVISVHVSIRMVVYSRMTSHVACAFNYARKELRGSKLSYGNKMRAKN